MLASKAVSPLNSPPRQLMEAPVASMLFAYETALNRFVSLLLAASTSTILAAGASAWARSMSSDSSSTHPLFVLGVPCGSACRKHGPDWDSEVQAESWAYPYRALKALRSDSACGSWQASTMAMIWPAPAPDDGASPDSE